MWSPCEFTEKTPFRDFRRRTRGQGASVGRAVGQFGWDESQSLGNGQKHGRKTHHFCLKGRLTVEMVSFWRGFRQKIHNTVIHVLWQLPIFFWGVCCCPFQKSDPPKGEKIERKDRKGFHQEWENVGPWKLCHSNFWTQERPGNLEVHVEGFLGCLKK